MTERTMNLRIIILSLFCMCLAPDAYCQTSLDFWHDKERELRYVPDGDAFVNVNGKKRFTRAIYGTNTGFRFETSDYPEIGLYMPRLGGSMYLALQNGNRVLWVKDLEKVESRFRSGQRTYTLSDDAMLGKDTRPVQGLPGNPLRRYTVYAYSGCGTRLSGNRQLRASYH